MRFSIRWILHRMVSSSTSTTVKLNQLLNWSSGDAFHRLAADFSSFPYFYILLVHSLKSYPIISIRGFGIQHIRFEEEEGFSQVIIYLGIVGRCASYETRVCIPNSSYMLHCGRKHTTARLLFRLPFARKPIAYCWTYISNIIKFSFQHTPHMLGILQILCVLKSIPAAIFANIIKSIFLHFAIFMGRFRYISASTHFFGVCPFVPFSFCFAWVQKDFTLLHMAVVYAYTFFISSLFAV